MPILDPVTPQPHLHAFTGYGIELEYMIVERDSLQACPLADRLLVDAAGAVVNEVAHGAIAWSNELVAHVIELKTNGPARSLDRLDGPFAEAVAAINERLETDGAMLLPTAMHPLFDPAFETVLWSHGQNEIYEAYDRIFDCRGHGWSNLQSMHLNLPFANDEEFRRLHAAIRVVLPLIPALAASSPLEQGRLTGWCDRRLFHYRNNQARIPEIAGLGIPEAVDGIDDYHARILAPMYRAIAPHDPDGILADDWLNSRGAIARFERQTIEIRLVDLQECPAADLAVAEALVRLVRRLYDDDEAGFSRQQALSEETLSGILFELAEHGGAGMIADRGYLGLLGLEAPMSGQVVWRHLLRDGLMAGSAYADVIERQVERGTLAECIVGRLGACPGEQVVVDVYKELAQCLAENRLYLP
jgi:glutamate---cysteine ligase / carboxylate-amine ligase